MFTHIQVTILLSTPKSYAGHMIYCSILWSRLGVEPYQALRPARAGVAPATEPSLLPLSELLGIGAGTHGFSSNFSSTVVGSMVDRWRAALEAARHMALAERRACSRVH